MFDFFKKKNPLVLGLAVGSASVKLLELSRSHNQYCVESYAIVPITQAPDVIPHPIKQALFLSGTQLRCAAIAMPDSSVISKIIQLDTTLSFEEMEATIMAESEKHFHYPLHEVHFDFEILGPSPTGQQQLDVLLMASRSEQVNERIALANSAELTVNIVDIQSYALERACHFLIAQTHNHNPEKAILISDIGHHIVSVMILYKNKIIFSRTDEIQRPDMIIMHIQRARHFFFSSPQRQEITYMLLMGGGSYSETLCSLLETTLGIPASIVNPFTSMSVSPHVNHTALTNDARLLMTCLGLALRSFDI